VIALRDRNYPVEYLVAPDEGHGFARPVNNSAMIAASEKFLAKHLGGRYQESATPEVAKRLAEITVDPASVKLATTTAATTTTVGPAANVAGIWNMSVDAGGQTISLAVTLTQTGADFSGTMSSSVSNGKFENGKVNGNTLTATINADIQGQPTSIQFEGKVEGEKMSGSLNVPGFGILPFSAVKSN